MQSRVIRSSRLAALLLALALACSLLPVFAGQAHAETCSNCGNDVTPVLTYDGRGELNLYEPTCTEAGMGIYVCPVCGIAFGRPVQTGALGHSYSASASTATCTEDGEVVYTCVRCGDSYSEHSSAVGHDYHRSGTAATCTEAGSYTYTCVRCGTSYTETEPALGHDYVHEGTEPTCTEPGVETDVCSRCGDEKKVEKAALGHSWPAEWTVAKEATNSEEGLEYRECQRCGLREERAIPKTGLPIAIVIGGVIVILAGIAFGVRKYLAAKAVAAGAAVTAAAAATASGFELVKLTEKKILAHLRDAASNQEFLQLVRSRPNLSLVLFDPGKPATLSEQIEAADPDAVLMDCADEAEFDQMMAAFAEIRAEHGDVRFEAIAFDADGALIARLAAEKDAGALFAYADDGQNKYVKMSQLIVPLYKDLLKDADSLESIGIIADMFGIPGVSTLLGAISGADRAKDLAETAKDALTGVEMEASDGVSVVHNIAALLGIDAIAAVSELTEDVLDTRDSLTGDEEGKTHKAYKAGEVGKDIGDVIGTLLG